MQRAERIVALMARGSPPGQCWAFVVAVERELFGRVLPAVPDSAEPNMRWVKNAFASHPQRQRWTLRPPARHGLAGVTDGALVLMSGAGRPHHVGVWLKRERAVLHADHQGVKFEDVLTLRARGLTRLRFYEPKYATRP